MRERNDRRGTGDRRVEAADCRWESFAREDAEYYILTDKRTKDVDVDRETFFRSGRHEAAAILAESEVRDGGLAVEIGCGVGRLTLPMAGHFHQVIGMDISPTMLDKLVRNCRERDVHNVSAVLVDNASWPDGSADFIYSRLVFQHIEHERDIARYVGRICHALRPGGRAYLQFDTRRRNLGFRVRGVLPDSVLPRVWRRGIRRVRRSPDRVESLIRHTGLTITSQSGRRTADHSFVVLREGG